MRTQNVLGSFASWGKRGTILYSILGNNDGCYLVPSTGGSPMRVTKVDTSKREFAHWPPHFLPDGKHFLYSSIGETWDIKNIYVGSVDSEVRKLVLSDADLLGYVSPGYLIYVHGSTVMAQSFNVKNTKLSGEPIPIIAQYDPERFRVTASETGVMVFQNRTSNRQLTWFDRQGNRLGKIGKEGPYRQITLSPDDKRLAAEIGGELRIADIDRSVFSPFARGGDAIWSPAGDRLLFTSKSKIFVKNMDGGAETLFLDTPGTWWPEDWTQDERYVVALGKFANGDSIAIWALPSSGNQEPIQLVAASFHLDEPQVSPNGRFLAYTANETGRFEVYVQPFLQRGRRIRISSGGGSQPRWRRDSKELFFFALDGTLKAVDIGEKGTIPAGEPKRLFDASVHVVPITDQFAVTGDGQRFIVITEADEASPPFHVVLNWPEAFTKQ